MATHQSWNNKPVVKSQLLPQHPSNIKPASYHKDIKTQHYSNAADSCSVGSDIKRWRHHAVLHTSDEL